MRIQWNEVVKSKTVKLEKINLGDASKFLEGKGLEGLPLSLLQTKRYYNGLVDFCIKPDPDQKKIGNKKLSYQDNIRAYQGEIFRYLEGEEIDLLAHRRKYTWASDCGTGAESYDDSIRYIDAITQLNNKSYMSALSEMMWIDIEGNDQVELAERIKWIEHLGLDWEMLYFGGLLEPDYFAGFCRGKFKEGLALFGTEKTARYLVQARPIIPKAHRELKEMYYSIVARFINPDLLPEHLRKIKEVIKPSLMNELKEIYTQRHQDLGD